jgi:ent-kaurene oxidase
MLVTNVIFDLCAHPEYIEPLREEWKQVMAEHDGVYDKKTNLKLRKLDSFIKESQRLHAQSILSMARYIREDLTFSNGTTIPKGSFIATSRDSINLDPKLFENPEKFDGWRFEKLRAMSKESSTRWQLVNTHAEENLNFGHGKHACPGRFFAAAEVSLVVFFLRNRDTQMFGF